MANKSIPVDTKNLSLSIDALLAGDASTDGLTRSLFNYNYERTRETDPELAEMMRACAIPSRFNAEVIGVLRDKPKAHKGNQRLLSGIKEFNFVLTRKDGQYVYHDSTRDVLLNDWKRQGKSRKQYDLYVSRLVLYYRGKAFFHLERGEYEESLANFNQAIALQPNNVALHMQLGMAHARLKDYASAIVDVTEAIRLDPSNANAYYWRSSHYFQLQNYSAAVSDLTEAIKLNPKNFAYYFGRGMSHSRLGEHKASLSDFNRAIKLKPKVGLYYWGRGVANFNLNRFKASVSDFTEAVKLEPVVANYYNWRAVSYDTLGDFNSALSDMTSAIKLESQEYEYRYARGVIRYKLKRYKSAVTDFTKAAELKHEVSNTYYFRALCYISLNEKAKALRDIKRSVELETRRPSHPLFWQGVVRQLQGKVKDAQSDWREAASQAQLHPDICEQFRILAKVSLLEGNLDSAYKHYRKALTKACVIYQHRMELNYLNQLTSLFPSNQDIRTVKEWFEERLRLKKALPGN